MPKNSNPRLVEQPIPGGTREDARRAVGMTGTYRVRSGGGRRLIPEPMNADYTRLSIHPSWCLWKYHPTYIEARKHVGDDLENLTMVMAEALAPNCLNVVTGASIEFRDRIELSNSVLLNSEGVVTRYPEGRQLPVSLNYPVKQPWLRALLMGYL